MAPQRSTRIGRSDDRSPAPGTESRIDDAALLDAIRQGDERAFEQIVDQYHGRLRRVAVGYVRDPAAADDVVQETWLGFLSGIDRFEGRCSIKTWLFRILFNKAQTRASKDERQVPFTTLAGREAVTPSRSVDPTRFHGAADRGETGHWVESPPRWKTDPERMLLDKEIRTLVSDAIDELPPAQRTVILMRDVEGFTSSDVCNELRISATNQRVLLHRARTKVRRALAARLTLAH